MPPKGSRKLDAKQAARLRRHQLEEEKRRLARRDRLRTWTYAGVGVLAGAGIILAVVLPQALKPTPIDQRSLASFGTSADKAGCGATTSPKAGKDVQIGPGSPKPKQTKASYPSAPPVGGAHYVTPLASEPHFYGVGTHPKVEQLVANELQSQTVVWYLRSLPSSQVKTLRELSQRMAVDNPDFLVAPWDTGYGKFPAGKQVAFATKGHVQYCAGVSGAAAAAFVARFPAVAPTAPPTTTPPAGTPSGTGTPAPSGSGSHRPGKGKKSSAPAGTHSPTPSGTG